MPKSKETPIRAARIHAGIAQNVAAKKLGISVATLLRYEQGVRIPSGLLIGHMANLYHCSTRFLTGIKEVPINNDTLEELTMNFLQDPLKAIAALGGPKSEQQALGALHQIYKYLVEKSLDQSGPSKPVINGD